MPISGVYVAELPGISLKVLPVDFTAQVRMRSAALLAEQTDDEACWKQLQRALQAALAERAEVVALAGGACGCAAQRPGVLLAPDLINVNIETPQPSKPLLLADPLRPSSLDCLPAVAQRAGGLGVPVTLAVGRAFGVWAPGELALLSKATVGGVDCSQRARVPREERSLEALKGETCCALSSAVSFNFQCSPANWR